MRGAGGSGACLIKVLLAEDMHLVRGALVALLNQAPDIEVVAETGSGAKVLSLAVAHEPDVAVLDIELPGVDGITLADELRRKVPACRVLIVTSYGRPGNVRRAFAARVTGFMVKDAPPDELADAIRKVAAGQRVIDPKLGVAALDVAECPLSERELDVLRRFADGDDLEEIARRLYLSVGTVRNYLTRIVSKLGARNRLHAVRIAQDAGWM